MLIECPACHTRASLPDSKEGAKVRCGECQRVYVARATGAQPRRRSSSSLWILGGGLAVALAAVLYMATRPSGEKSLAAKEPVPEPVHEELLAEPTVWDSEAVQAAVAIHTAAFDKDAAALASALHGPGVFAQRKLLAETEDRAVADAIDPLQHPEAKEFLRKPPEERAALLAEWARELIEEPGSSEISAWRPYDVEIDEAGDKQTSFRLAVTARDPARGGEKRWIQWYMLRDDGRWKAWSWSRYLDEAEIKARKRYGTETVELTGGYKVKERDPEPLEHLESTPPELRQRIEVLYATMTDLDLTREASKAGRLLVEVGKPAVPILLTGLYANPLETEEDCIRGNIAVEALRQITGQYFGYRPRVGEGALATSEEYRDSSIRQWFAWWYQNELTFEGKETEDGLEGLIELSEEEQRWLERQEKKQKRARTDN